MTPMQLALEIRDRLRLLRWPESAPGAADGELVFGQEAYVVGQLPSDDNLPGSWPYALIFIGSGSSDADEKLLQTVPITVVVGQYQEGDLLGEQAIVGGPRSNQEITTSAGRGVLEVCAVTSEAIGDLNGEHGLPIVFAYQGTPTVERITAGAAHLVQVPIGFTTLCTAFPEYRGPYNVEAVGGARWRAAGMIHGLVEYLVVGGVVDHPSEGPLQGSVGPNVLTFAGATAPFTVFAGYSLVEDATKSQVYSERLVGTWRT